MRFPINPKQTSRKSLPAFRDPKQKVQLWTILK